MRVYKALSLVIPEFAIRHGVYTEGPVFVSPYIETKRSCRKCKTKFSPVVYRFGRPTYAQHYCENGGIYSISFSPTINEKYGEHFFVATGETIDVIVDDKYGVQSKAIILHSLMVRCAFCKREMYSDETIILLRERTNSVSCFPVCENCNYDYIFRRYPLDLYLTSDGQPLFTSKESATVASV